MKVNDKHLGHLIELISALTTYEIELFKKEYLSSKVKVSKMLNLFHLIEVNKKVGIEIALSKISPNSSISSFHKLIRRLIIRIEEFLLTSVVERQKDNYVEMLRTKLTVRKELLKYDILISKGLYSLADLKLKKIIRKSKDFEYYGELLDALYRQFSRSNKVTKSNLNDYLNEIEIYESYRRKSLIASTYYNTYKKHLIATANLENISFSLEQKLGELLIFAEETNSANIYSYYYILAMEYCFKKGNIQEEITLGLNFIKLIKESKAVYSKSRIGFINSSLSNSSLSAGNFKLSKKLAKNAIKCINPEDKINYGTAYLLMIKSLIYLVKNRKVQALLNKIKFNYSKYFIDYHRTRLHYYEIVSYFALNEFQLSFNLLNNLKELEKDKEGWNIWIQVLRIQIYLELERFSETEYLIENLRKYLERNREKYQIKERLFLISKLFIELKTCNFDFKKAAEKKAAVLNKLKSLDEEFRWDGRTPEMILFHDWFEAKVNDQPYQANFEPYRIDLKVDIEDFESMKS